VRRNRSRKVRAWAGRPAVTRVARWRARWWRAGLVLLLTGVAFTTATVASAPASSAHSAAVVLTKRVSKPGDYQVTVTISSRSKRADHVRLRVGAVTRNAVLTGVMSVSLQVQVHIAGHSLTVVASSHRARPRIAVSLRRVALATVPRHVAPQPRTTGSPGATQAPVAPTAAPTAQPVSSPPALPAGETGNWRLVFGDEFNGSSLNTANWSSGWFGSGITGPLTSPELQCFDPAQVSVSGGELDLSMIAKAETCGGQTRPYASGIVTTNGKFSFTYGFVEARVWVPGTGGVIPDWPDVWTDGQNWPADGEIDIMEGLSGQACWNFHYPGGAPGWCSDASFTGGWHTFGVDWEPGSLTYFYDGANVGTVTTGVTSAPMYLILSLVADKVNGGPVGPATIRFDYVHVWQH
jgi:beta-glucanase (GH16 family)